MTDRETREAMDGPVQQRIREGTHGSWLRRHALVIVVALLGTTALLFFSWCDWHSFCMRQHQAHAQCVFFSRDYLAEWGYNASSNWQSELLFGVLLVVLLLKVEGPRGADKADTL